jgi:hypothetical protein
MDGLISMSIAVVVVVVIGLIIAFYFGGVWEKFTADAERHIEEQRQREEKLR